MFVRRFFQNFAHPQTFRQTVQLTDGSTIRVVATSNVRPFVKVGVDSLSHPSWNPRLRNKMQLSEHGEVAKFKEKFSSMDDTSLEDFGDMMDTNTSKAATVKPPPAKRPTSKPARKKQ